MNDRRNFSDESLNAFVDNQLGAQECDEILAAIAVDAELGQRLCALRSTKEMLRHAYGQLPPPRRQARRQFSYWSGALAASLTLVIGVLIGWLGHQSVVAQESPAATMARGERPAAMEPARFLIHLDSAEAEQMESALNLAEAHLAKSSKARVEIIANNGGLNLLRVRTSPYADRIADIKSHHKNVGFVACGLTIARLQGGGLDTTLLPEAAVTRTAIEHVAERMQQGWTYLKI